MEEYPDRITLKDDGMYHWRYQLSKEQAREHWITMIWICTIVTTVVAVIMTMLIGLKEVWPYLLLLYGMLVGLPALIGYLTLGWDSRSYTMDEECIRHKHATKGGDAFIFYKKVKEAYVERNAFTIKEGITTYTVYVPPEDVRFMKDYLKKRIPPEAVTWHEIRGGPE